MFTPRCSSRQHNRPSPDFPLPWYLKYLMPYLCSVKYILLWIPSTATRQAHGTLLLLYRRRLIDVYNYTFLAVAVDDWVMFIGRFRDEINEPESTSSERAAPAEYHAMVVALLLLYYTNKVSWRKKRYR